MLFNSGVFLKFFAAFLLLYWLARDRLPARNLLIVVASFVFYGWWDYRFLGLLVLSSLLDYTVGLVLMRTENPRRRKIWLAASMTGNLTILGVFKYYDFFITSFSSLLQELGIPFHAHTLGVILPVGISFYTFQSMSYAVDVYRRELPATRNLVQFLAYITFFPQLVAGPIERAWHLLPQFERPLAINGVMLEEGVWLVLWGMFKKVVVADNMAPLVDLVYGGASFTSPAVLLGTVAFAVQIYCDFSGYSDIARGTARLLGFDIMFNFNLPYAATSLREFWHRWHISLSSWLRDYLYISLGGNRRGTARTYVNLFLTMLLGGLWHGAAWNFVLWGTWHGAGLMVQRWLGGGNSGVIASRSNTLTLARQLVRWAVTLGIVLYGWLLFRAGSLPQIIHMTAALVDFRPPVWFSAYLANLVVFSVPLVLAEVWFYRAGSQLAALSLPRWSRAALEAALLLGIIMFWEKDKVPFIYFQF